METWDRPPRNAGAGIDIHGTGTTVLNVYIGVAVDGVTLAPKKNALSELTDSSVLE